MFWMSNTDGKKDAVLTMTFMGFVVVLFKFIFSGISLNVFGHTINFGSVDAAVVGALLTPTLGAYCARRYTDKKYADGSDGGVDEVEVPPGVEPDPK